MGKVRGAHVVIGIPSFGMVSTFFLQSRISQQFPLVSSAIDHIVLNKPIADARNEIVEFALSQGAGYIYWLDDDVIAPPDTFLKLYRHNKDIVNGVYWAKCSPTMPLLFRGHLEGPYWDWHVGDLIEIDAAGNGLTLVKTDVYRKIQKELGEPWYSVDYGSFVGVKSFRDIAVNNTEDLYFYWKAKSIGYKVWADTSVQAYHYDKSNTVLYGMPPSAPQATPVWVLKANPDHPNAEIKPRGNKLVADLGSGAVTQYAEEGEVVTFDIREECHPDVLCDIRYLPVPDETFDIVFSIHTLEHFGWRSVDTVLKEWSRILKVGGELRLAVPNLRHVAQRILDDKVLPTDFWVLYGEQDYPKNFHAMGFTPSVLENLVKSLGIYEDIQVKEGDFSGPPGDESWLIQLKATKSRHIIPENITPDNSESPPPYPAFIPVRTYEELVERPLTQEEINKDIKKHSKESLNPEVDAVVLKKEIVEKAKTYKKKKEGE